MNITRRTALLATTAAAGGALLAGCAQRLPVSERGVYRLRYASPYAPGHTYSRADISWLKAIAESSHGELQLQPFWGGALIGESDTVRELGAGVADASYLLPIYTRAGAHLIRGQAAFYRGTSTMEQQEEVFRELWQQFPALKSELPGVHMLLATGGAPIQVMTGTRPITRLADLRGLRLRASAELAPVFDQLGVDAEFMAMGEVYSAISKGTIDGLTAPLDVLRSMRLAEVVKHVTMLNIPRGAYPSRGINVASMAALPAHLQACIERSLPVWQNAMRTEVTRATEAGGTFGAEHRVQMSMLEANSQREFAAIYDEQALQRARDLDALGLPGSAVLTRAHQIIHERGYDNS
jgi:TRAP-type C4-dicarboxylate transport system substrate-binding protein